MRILSLEEAAQALKVADLYTFVGGGHWVDQSTSPDSFLQADSGAKIGLARVLANTFLDRGSAVLWIAESGIWQGSEHLDLFTRYRLSHGETRTVVEAPVHLFESTEDRDSFISILSLGLFFMWGLEVVSLDLTLAVTISHDEWLDYRIAAGEESFTLYFERWIAPYLRSPR